MVDGRSEAGLVEEILAHVRVTIVGAQGWANSKGPMDIYCLCEVQDDVSMRFQTPVVEYSMAPRWNLTHDFPTFNAEKMLNFSVWEKKEPRDACVGRVALEPYQFIPNGFIGEANLKGAGQGSRATLSLKIDVVVANLSSPRANNIRPGEKIGKGTKLVCITNTDIYAIVGSHKKIGRMKAGDRIEAAGRPRDSDGESIVPIEPRGAVNLACLDLDLTDGAQTHSNSSREAPKGNTTRTSPEISSESEADDEVAFPAIPESIVSTPRHTSRRDSRKRLQDASVAGMQQAETTAKAYNLQRLFVKLRTKAETQRELDEREKRRKEREALEKELSEQAVRRQVNAAVRIQTAFRGKLARLKIELEKRKERESELLAQEARRREKEAEVQRKQVFIAKKRLQDMHTKKLNQFATRIQAARRGQLARREARKLRNEKGRADRIRQRDKTWQMIQDVEARKQEKAALRVQRTWRWQKLRRWLRKEAAKVAHEKRVQATGQRMLRLQEKRKLDIITKLQATWRGRKAREELRRRLKEKERLQYEREVVRILELKKIQAGARRAEHTLDTSDELRVIRETQRQKEEDITLWLQGQEEVWRWCLEQESRYAALRKSVEAGADGDLSKWREEEATQWQSYQRGDAAVNVFNLLDSRTNHPGSRSPLLAADVLQLDNKGDRVSTLSPSSPRRLQSSLNSPTFRDDTRGDREATSLTDDTNLPRYCDMRAFGSPLGSPNTSPQGIEERRHPQKKLARKRQPVQGSVTSSAVEDYGDSAAMSQDIPGMSYVLLCAEEQRCVEKFKEVIPAKRNQLLRQRWALAMRRNEHLQQRLLLNLSATSERCHRCDVGLASLQMLMQALEGVCRITHDFFLQRKDARKKEHRESLLELLDQLAAAAIVDTLAQEYGDEVIKELSEEVPELKDPEPAPKADPAPDFESMWQKAFDGHWKKEGSSSRYMVKGEQVRFLDSSARHEFQNRGRGRCAMNVNGDIFQGRFIPGEGTGKDRIRWTNGSSDWMKEDAIRTMYR